MRPPRAHPCRLAAYGPAVLFGVATRCNTCGNAAHARAGVGGRPVRTVHRVTTRVSRVAVRHRARGRGRSSRKRTMSSFSGIKAAAYDRESRRQVQLPPSPTPCVPPRPRRRSVRAQWRWSSCTERVGEDDNTTLARQRCASGAAPRLVHLYAVRATSTVHSAPLKTPVCVVRAAPAADDGAVCVRPSQKVRQRLRCAAALMRLQVPRNRVSPDLGFSELNEAPHVKRLQLAKNVAEGCRAQCSGHPAQEVALPHQANRGLATPNNRFWRSRAA